MTGCGTHGKKRTMKKMLNIISPVRNQRGVSMVIVGIAIGSAMLIGFAALAIDVGYLFAARNELQNTADASALAATRKLGELYQTMTYDEQQAYECDPAPLIAIAKEVALKNQAARTNIVINDADIVIGQWDGQTRTLTPTLFQPDAIQVTARRDADANGPITTFFARVFNIQSMDVIADATAALTGKGTSEPGELELPIGISQSWFDRGYYCGSQIKFSPTTDPDACAGWTAFEENPNDKTLRNILAGLITSPATSTSDPTIFNFIGGDLSNPTFDALLTLFQGKGCDVDASGNPILDSEGNPMTDATGTGLEVPLWADAEETIPLTYPDGTARNEHVWETTVVIYGWDTCDNPNKPIPITGYARILLTDVLDAPSKSVKGIVLCNLTDDDESRGGGGDYGTKGSIPGLVE